MKHLFLIIIFKISILALYAQSDKLPLQYYLPDIKYNTQIPTPEQYLGFQIGQWHVTHDQLAGYFKVLDAASDRVELVEYGKTHENRPLLLAIISSPEHLKNKEKIKKQHEDLLFSGESPKDKMPAVVWQGHTIHGNEPSGNNAALLVAYYLAAGQSKEVNEVLDNMVILMDPCLNPDGVQRFSTWVNSHKSVHLVSDPVSREFSEVWPGGRFNHYWFDMNRDWLLLTQPESRGRVKLMHEWHPDVLTDHHEMGTNSTFFFQPGIPTGNNPNTPVDNFKMTEEIGKFHAKALDSIGSLYYTKYNFDDFYYGKGSTYPDAIGAIGILFEQASSRGHLQESINGPLSFPFTIKNQVVTSLSTQNAIVSLKAGLLKYKSEFQKNVLSKIDRESVKAYIFTDNDALKMNKFIDLLLQHHIEVYSSETDIQMNQKKFSKGKSYIVPLHQKNPILAKTIFETVKTFQDSSFYDVSGWTLSYAYGLTVEPLLSYNVNSSAKILHTPEFETSVSGENENIYAYLLPPTQYNLHRAIYYLQSKRITVRIAQTDLSYVISGQPRIFPKGTAVVTCQNQSLNSADIATTMATLSADYKINIHAVATGNGTSMYTLGHPFVLPVTKPEVAYIVGPGISAQSSGEIWHHSDINLAVPMTMLENQRFRTTSLKRYNTIILPEGNYSLWGETEVNKLKEWCQQGNTIIGIGSACYWLIDKKIVTLNQRKDAFSGPVSGVYENVEREAEARIIAGSIFNTQVDLSHPLFYGFEDSRVAVIKTGNKFFDVPGNKYASPSKYAQDFLISGYLPRGAESIIRGAPAITVHSSGNGKIICFQDDPLFRGYWLAGQKIFNNAVFYNSLIDKKTMESGYDE
ncbi:MAG: zinc carboxypeptidase [Saprospiraceae bacterium]|nr:zinc carboxypeptidase [Saprospiraceae bacterium]